MDSLIPIFIFPTDSGDLRDLHASDIRAATKRGQENHLLYCIWAKQNPRWFEKKKHADKGEGDVQSKSHNITGTSSMNYISQIFHFLVSNELYIQKEIWK